MSPKTIVLRCFAQGYPGSWEAFCVDFDISVQGRDFHDVQHELEQAVQDYVAAAMQESPETCKALLNRRAPFLLVLWWSLKTFVSAWLPKNGEKTYTTAFFPAGYAV